MTIPLPDIEAEPTARFWLAAVREELQLPRCRICGRIDWYPKGTCRGCGSTEIAWTRLSGSSRLFSWSVVYRALDPRLAPLAPYVSAIVALKEDSASRLVTRLIDTPIEMLTAGMPLVVRFRDLGHPAITTGVTAPLFAAAG